MKSLNQNFLSICELLSDGEYHDGTSIGHQLNITRTAVWKVIKKLEEYSVPLTSIKGKGYRLESPLTLLDNKKIKAKLRHRAIHLDVLEKIDSTNDYLKTFMPNNTKIRVCIAEMQKSGRGRLQREWHSPFGQNIYFSMLVPFQKDVAELSGLSLIVGLAISHAIEAVISVPQQQIMMKWPNDVVVDNKKLAGTLIEIQAESNGFCQAIIGIGINVNMAAATKNEINKPWTSLANVTGLYQDRNHLCASLIDTLIDYIEQFSLQGPQQLIESWQTRDSLLGKSIVILSGKNKFQGICQGVNAQGYLLLKTADNSIQTISSGDATLQK